LGGDAESLSGILRATTQVFSKGKVQAEELRGQIGDRLAGAFGDFAAASGKSTAELDKNLEDGEVSLADFLKFAQYVGNKYGDSADRMAKSGENAGARLTKAIENLQLAAGPLLTDIGANFQDLGTQIIEALTPAIAMLGNLVTKLREMELAQINNRIQTLQQALEENPNSERNQQSLKNLIERRDQISGALQPPVVKTQPKQQQQTLGNVLSPEDQDRLIKRAAASLEAAKNLTTELERQVLLSEATNDLDRDALQLEFELQDKMAQISKLEDQRFRGQQAILAQRVYDVKLADLLKKDEEERTKELNKQVKAFDDALRPITEERNELDAILAGKHDQYKIEKAINDLMERNKNITRQQAEELVRGNAERQKAVDYLQQQQEKLDQLYRDIAGSFVSAIDSAFDAAVDGTKNFNEALVDLSATLLETIGKLLLFYAIGSSLKALAGGGKDDKGGILTYLAKGFGFAEGGYVTSPTNATVGEGGSDEYIVPSSKMDGAMQRWNQGMRGDAVVSGAEPTGGYGGAALAEAPTNIVVEGGVLNFNDSQYIRQDQIPSIVKQASSAGEARALRKLQMSPSARKRVGI
jgi:tape measure domain-containing protein